MEGRIQSVLRLIAVSSLIFGGLHCIVWSFEFPSRIELFCWRAASLTSAVLLVVALAFSSFMNYFATTHAERECSSAILACLQGLEQFPDLWWQNILEGPMVLRRGDIESFRAFFSLPPKARDWEDIPSKIEEHNADLDWPSYHYTIHNSWRRLRAFRILWAEMRDDKHKIIHTNVESLLNYYDDLFKIGDFSNQLLDQLLAEYWQEYEQYLRTKVGQTIQLPKSDATNSF